MQPDLTECRSQDMVGCSTADFLPVATCSVSVSFQLSINGDKEFLDNAHKVNPYHMTPVIAVAVKQSEESQEAGPLPVKVDLNKTFV